MPAVRKGNLTLPEASIGVCQGETPGFNVAPEKFGISGPATDGGTVGKRCQVLGPILGSP